MTKYESLLEDFQNALMRFEEVLQEQKTDVMRDSAIKRFELCFDLAWKTVKAFLEEEHNVTCVSPRNCFREAFRVGLIEYDKYWIDIASVRNYTVHIYKEALAEKVYMELPKARDTFKKLMRKLDQSSSKNQ